MTEKNYVASMPRPKVRLARYLVPLVLLGLGVHILLPQIATMEHSLQVIRGMRLWAVALAVLAQILAYLGNGYLLGTLVAVTGEQLSVLRGTVIFTAAASVGLSGGGLPGSVATTYRWTRGSGINTEGATLAGWLPMLFTNATLIVAGIFGLIHLLIAHELSIWQAIGFGLMLLLLLLVASAAAWGVHHRSQLTALAVRLGQRWAALRRRPYDPGPTEAAVARWFSAWNALRNGGWRGPVIGATLNTAFDMLTLYFLFIAVGHPVSLGILLSGYGLPLLLGRVSFLPGGVGLVEGTMAALYDGLGVPSGVTVVVVLIYRFFSFWLPLLIGFPLILYLQHVAGNTNNPFGDGQ
jgi:uncharacterized protein (TIRG00374 family)